MTEPASSRVEFELTEPWTEPIYREDPVTAIPARPSAPGRAPAGAMSPPHTIQAFSAVPLVAAAAPSVVNPTPPRRVVAAVLGVALLAGGGLGAHLALRDQPEAARQSAVAGQPTSVRPVEAPALRPTVVRSTAPAKSAASRRVKAAPAAKSVKQQPAAQAQAAASAKPGTPSRAAKFADEPAAPNRSADCRAQGRADLEPRASPPTLGLQTHGAGGDLPPPAASPRTT